jgi:hypothetical protein
VKHQKANPTLRSLCLTSMVWSLPPEVACLERRKQQACLAMTYVLAHSSIPNPSVAARTYAVTRHRCPGTCITQRLHDNRKHRTGQKDAVQRPPQLAANWCNGPANAQSTLLGRYIPYDSQLDASNAVQHLPLYQTPCDLAK